MCIAYSEYIALVLFPTIACVIRCRRPFCCSVSFSLILKDHQGLFHVNAQWSGSPSLSDSSRVAILPVSSRAPYITQVAFSSLMSRDSGTYVCRVQITSLIDAVVNSSTVAFVSTISISTCKHNVDCTNVNYVCVL